jgi:hypothetical protein
VTTSLGTGTSPQDFFIAPPPYRPENVQATGRIGFGESRTVTLAGANAVALFVFDGELGQRVSLTATRPGSGPVTFLNPDGTTLASTGTGGTLGFIEAQGLPVTGTYTLLVASPGTTTVTLYQVPPDLAGPLTLGSPVAVTITTPGQKARYTFAGTTGQRVSLVVGSGATLNARVSIVGAAGGTVASTFTIGAGFGFIEPTPLPADGTYTLLVEPTLSSLGLAFLVGTATVTAHDVPPDVTGTIGFGQPVTVTLTAPGQSARLTFLGTAGQRVSLGMTSVTLTGARVFVLKPDGTTLTSTAPPFLEPVTLPASGTYTLLVDPIGAGTGSVTLTLSDVPPDVTGTLAVNGAGLTVTIAAPGQNALVTFAGTAGQAATVRVTGNTIAGVTVTLLRQSGATLAVLFSSAASFTLAPQTLPATETYTVRIDPLRELTGSLTVSVTSP